MEDKKQDDVLTLIVGQSEIGPKYPPKHFDDIHEAYKYMENYTPPVDTSVN